jgi:hypothetical protein
VKFHGKNKNIGTGTGTTRSGQIQIFVGSGNLDLTSLGMQESLPEKTFSF